MENIKLTILGSGGATTTPRPFCQCAVCKKARKVGEPFKRNSSSLFINNIQTVIDCGEDIADSLNRRDIKDVKNLFITHWHPDHTFGLRPILEANFDFISGKAKKAINLFIPKDVFETLKKRYTSIEHMINTQKTANLHLIEDGEPVKIDDITLSAVKYSDSSETYAYLIQGLNKKILYAPCDTISFDRYNKLDDLDLLINECGVFSDDSTEIFFGNLMNRVKEIKPKRTILTHIEEIDICHWGEEILQQMKEKYPDVNFDYAYDGMEV